MAIQNAKEEEMRRKFYAYVGLSKENERLMDEYLDMDGQESSELLGKVGSEDFRTRIYVGSNKYFQWLRKEKRTETLSRCVCFLVTAGGSTAWRVLVNDIDSAGMKDLDRMLSLYTGEHAEERKMAVRAGFAVEKIYRMDYQDVKALCMSGKEHPEHFMHAMGYCLDCDGYQSTGKSSNARLLLAAMYLHHIPPTAEPEAPTESASTASGRGAAEPEAPTESANAASGRGAAEPEAPTESASAASGRGAAAPEAPTESASAASDSGAVIQELIKGIIAAIKNIASFEYSELKDIQTFALNAEQDTPFPQRILSIYAKRNKMNPALLASCAFLALRHSVRFEILLRLMVAMNFRFLGSDPVLDACRGITEEEWFDARMDEIEDMLPIQDDTYVLWGLHAGCRSVVERMAVKCPNGIKGAAAMASSDSYRELVEIVREANQGLYEEMKAAYKDTLLSKMVQEILQRLYTGREAARDYLSGKKPVDVLEPYLEEWRYDSYGDLKRERCRVIERLKELGELPTYRRAVVLEAMRKGRGFFTLYSFCNGQIGAASDGTGEALLYRRDQIDGILRFLEEERVPVRMQAEALGGIFDSVSDKKKKNTLSELCVEVFAQRQQGQDQGQWKAGMESAVAEGSITVCCFCLSVLEKLGGGQYRDIILSCADINAKQIREQVLSICRGHREWKPEIVALLASKKVKEREFAALVVEEWEDASCLEAVRAAAEREKNKKLLVLLQELAEELETERRAEQEQGTAGGEEQEAGQEQGAARGTGQEAGQEQGTAGGTGQEAGQEQGITKGTGQEAGQELGTVRGAGQEAGQELGQGREQAESAARLPGAWKRKEERLAAEVYKGARKRKVEWVQGLALPKVHDRNGEEVPPEYMFAILAIYADMEIFGISPDASRLAAILESGEVSLYMQSLYGEWMSMGAEAKKRWVLYAVSVHGGAAIVPVFYRQIKEWSEHSRGAMAAEAVKALALNSSSEALLLVDQMSRKYKFRQVKNAAGEALANAADMLGISREELEDRLVPNLGLNGQMERVFDYGSRSFTVRLNSALEMEVYDGNGKQLKNLPSPGKQDDPDKAGLASDEFKQMKKQLKTVIQNQKLRLEQALSTARFWDIQDWQKLFVKNPVMHQFAVGLIWGAYENGILKETFRYMEDGSFNTVDESEYTLPGTGILEDGSSGTVASEAAGAGLEAVIGLIHPLELSEEELAAWREQLSDYEIVQPFEQLNRTIYRVTEKEADASAFTQFNGRMINGLSLSGKLLNMGWFRGEVLDAGVYENYYRKDGDVGAELTFSGSSVGYENEDVTVYHIYFYRFADYTDGGAYSAFSKENRCKLNEVSPRYFSEIIRQAAKALGEVDSRGQ